MAQHHYLGALPKIGETVWYVATWREQGVCFRTRLVFDYLRMTKNSATAAGAP